MAAGTGIYITWITGAIILSIAMMPLFKPPYAKLRLEGFIDMFRRYWAHMIVVFSVYLWKDLLDGMDRVLMASTTALPGLVPADWASYPLCLASASAI